MNLKKELIVVFHPYVKKGDVRPFRYKVISINRLVDYIPIDRMQKEVERFFNSGLEKDNFYVKQCGKVYLYRK
jgi:hypothetical protein